MNITLQFITEKDLASWIIRYATWSDYSHVDFVLNNYQSKNGKTYNGLLGARMSGGVELRPFDYAKFSKVAHYQCATGNESIIEYAISQIGKKYDTTGIINFSLHRDWQADDSWFCSELVAASFVQGGVPLLDIPQSTRVTPRDLTTSILLERTS